MSSTLVAVISIAAFLLICCIFGFTMYVKAPPAEAYILSGLKKEPRVLIGRGGFKVPIIERMDRVFLGAVSVDVKTIQPVPTNDFIDVMADGICRVQTTPTLEGVRLAAKNFLNMSDRDIAAQIKDTLEGNMREVIGAITLKDLVNDRDKFSDQVQQKAAKDMTKLGLDIISFNIQNITDKNGLIQGLGADNTYKIRKDAAITKANAEMEIAKAEAEASEAANRARVTADTKIAEQNNELAIKQADLQKISDTKKAEADAAYEIQKQEQMKTINTKTVDAKIEQTKREQILAEEEIQVTQNKLKAEVNAQADAAKYQVEIQAQATLEQQKRKAEADAYLAEQTAKAVRAKAEASKYAALQEAEGIAARGKAEAAAKQAVLEAEAAGILAKGQAEAEAMEKKAEAYKKSEFARLEMITNLMQNVLPQVAANVAAPMGNISSIKIYGSSDGASGVASNVPAVMKQAMDVVEDVTGVDMADIMRASSINAHTDRNISLSGVESLANLKPEETVKPLNESKPKK